MAKLLKTPDSVFASVTITSSRVLCAIFFFHTHQEVWCPWSRGSACGWSAGGGPMGLWAGWSEGLASHRRLCPLRPAVTAPHTPTGRWRRVRTGAPSTRLLSKVVSMLNTQQNMPRFLEHTLRASGVDLGMPALLGDSTLMQKMPRRQINPPARNGSNDGTQLSRARMVWLLRREQNGASAKAPHILTSRLWVP